MVLRPEHFSAKRLQNDTTTRQGFDRLVKRHVSTFGGEDGRVLFGSSWASHRAWTATGRTTSPEVVEVITKGHAA